MKIPEKLGNEIKRFIYNQLEKTYFWIGFKMEDTAMKAIEDRE